MSLRAALQAIGFLTVTWLLFRGLGAMGPVGWLVFGTMFLIGVIQVHRELREGNGTESAPRVTNCAECGAPNDPERTTCKHCDADL